MATKKKILRSNIGGYCINCCHWGSVDDEIGECRKYAKRRDRWPYTDKDDWCSEFCGSTAFKWKSME